MKSLAIWLSWSFSAAGIGLLSWWGMSGGPGYVDGAGNYMVGPLLRFVSLFCVGPLAYVPAAGLGKSRPKWSAAILLTGAPAFFVICLLMQMGDLLTAGVLPESTAPSLPALLVTGPMVIVGGLFAISSTDPSIKPPPWPLVVLVPLIVVPAATLVFLAT